MKLGLLRILFILTLAGCGQVEEKTLALDQESTNRQLTPQQTKKLKTVIDMYSKEKPLNEYEISSLLRHFFPNLSTTLLDSKSTTTDRSKKYSSKEAYDYIKKKCIAISWAETGSINTRPEIISTLKQYYSTVPVSQLNEFLRLLQLYLSTSLPSRHSNSMWTEILMKLGFLLSHSNELLSSSLFAQGILSDMLLIYPSKPLAKKTTLKINEMNRLILALYSELLSNSSLHIEQIFTTATNLKDVLKNRPRDLVTLSFIVRVQLLEKLRPLSKDHFNTLLNHTFSYVHHFLSRKISHIIRRRTPLRFAKRWGILKLSNTIARNCSHLWPLKKIRYKQFEESSMALLIENNSLLSLTANQFNCQSFTPFNRR